MLYAQALWVLFAASRMNSTARMFPALGDKSPGRSGPAPYSAGYPPPDGHSGRTLFQVIENHGERGRQRVVEGEALARGRVVEREMGRVQERAVEADRHA